MGHDGHSLHPHGHVIEGLPKPCAGRWWCEDCREWFSRKPCTVTGAPELPRRLAEALMAGRPRTRAKLAGLPVPEHLGEPQGAGTWQQFVPGNQVAVGNPAHLAHGTRSLSRTDQVADVIISDLIEMPTLPEFMKDPTYKYALRGWARAEARVVMYVTWMDRLSDDEQNNASGAQQAPVLKAAMLEDAALRHRGKLGLDPVSRVKIGKSLSSRGLDLAKMAAMEYGGEEDDQDDDD